MRILIVFLLTFGAAVLCAGEDPVIAALRAADEERIAATQSGDRKRLEAIHTSDLHYAHSSGKVEDFATHIDALVKKKPVYEKYEYVGRQFRLLAPGVAMMLGRVVIVSISDGTRQTNDLKFLSIWRLEQGQWRFAAWQGCKNQELGR